MTKKYPYLPEGRTIQYVPRSNQYMVEAEKAQRELSTDMLHPTGSVLVRNGKIIGRAGNQSALKNRKLIELHSRSFCVRRLFRIPSGQKYWMCPGCSNFKHHSESRAVRDALKTEKSVKGSDLYLFGHWWCCKPCWDAMIEAGVKRVFLVEGADELFAREKKTAKFIAIEGGEGSGKSSLLIALKEELGDKAIYSREPGGSPYAEVIRNAALKDALAGQASSATMLCLMFASRFDHVDNTVKPALQKSVSVITDRFDASSYAYNVHTQSKGKLEEVFWSLRKKLDRVPDVYIYVDVTAEEGIRRARSRNQSFLEAKNHFDDREIQFHKDVRDGYKKFFSKVRHVVVDANRPFEDVKKDFIAVVKREMGI